MNKPKEGQEKDGKIFVCCRYFRHYKTGKIIYPKKSDRFCFWVDAKEHAKRKSLKKSA